MKSPASGMDLPPTRTVVVRSEVKKSNLHPGPILALSLKFCEASQRTAKTPRLGG